ncbi:MAG TPA: serine/threonine protein kinase [Nocardiopsis listeri]|uniref:serine/threonine-protein kinase n=1 Tax=Nocardiopsis listeri TaxID=53440 RepID=UPI001D5AEF5B|nr:serine/threonine-protein kinase [Nocardiopsis listeri]HJE60359.1 serine/threonine protein kinase [Nocardiopsis listeri]
MCPRPVPSEPSPPTGFTPLVQGDPLAVGPFRLVGRLGEGGMGVVYGALDSTDRHVAVKVVHPRHAADPVFRAGFVREAELLSRVDSECSPAFFGADPHAQRPWMAIEFVPGGTLKDHVREHGVLTAERLLSFAAGTAEALAAVHQAGVMHRDLKPANVILSPSGPKVLDFGIARATDDHAPERGIFGTPGWVAPERLDGGRDTLAVDMFAWGGLVVYAATGHGPFGKGDTATLIARTRTSEPDLEGVPEELLPLVSAALSRDPVERPGAVEAFTKLLDLAGAGEPGEGPRERLHALLGRVWTGFPMVRGSGTWIAAGSVATLSGSAPLAGGGAGVVATKAAGAGTVAGMGKVTASVVASTLAVTVVTGAWVGGRMYSDQPILPGRAEETVAASDPATEPDLERAEFRGMTLTLPEGWTALTLEEEFGNFSVEAERVTEEWLLLYPGGQEGCEEVDWTWGYQAEPHECHHVQVLGPGGIAYGGEAWQPIVGPDGVQGRFHPGTDPGGCLDWAELREWREGEDLEEFEHTTVEVGAQEASYAFGAGACADPLSPVNRMMIYEQRSWLLDGPEILIVDNYGIEELETILAEADLPA